MTSLFDNRSMMASLDGHFSMALRLDARRPDAQWPLLNGHYSMTSFFDCCFSMALRSNARRLSAQ